MRSVAALVRRNAAPVPYVGESGFTMPTPFQRGVGRTEQLSATGAVSTLFSIVDLLSGDTSRVEWKLWRQAASGKPEDRTEVRQHLALKLWKRPNAFMTGMFLRQAVQQHIELTGEGFLLVARMPRVNMVQEIWYVRPDRIEPVRDAEKFLTGWTYLAPNGEKIPLGLDEVMPITIPSPLDPIRGMGAVQSLDTDLDATAYAAEWNKNFFRNSAEPGGVIEVPSELSDPAYDRFQRRWRSSHQGVRNAHRVAMLENGMKWVERRYTMRDMQFTDLRTMSRDVIQEAYRVHDHMLGKADDVNRANAEAAEVTHMRHLIKPRLVRWRELLNVLYLPMFGATDLEFDFVDPEPESGEDARADRDSKINAAVNVVTKLHATRESAAEAFDLPDTLEWDEIPEPVIAPPGTGSEAGAGRAPNQPAPGNRVPRIRAALPAVDLSRVQSEWTTALDRLLAEWESVQRGQRQELAGQVERHVSAQDLAALAGMSVALGAAASVLLTAMYQLAAVAARTVVAEAADQGIETSAAILTSDQLAPYAATTVELLGDQMAQSAGQRALALYAPGRRDAATVAAGVLAHLEGLSDASTRAQLGGALTRAQNSARLATLRIAPSASYFASEVLDRNTCEPCEEIHGHEFDNIDQADLAYLGGPYWACKGWPKCRGTVVASWNEAIA